MAPWKKVQRKVLSLLMNAGSDSDDSPPRRGRSGRRGGGAEDKRRERSQSAPRKSKKAPSSEGLDPSPIPGMSPYKWHLLQTTGWVCKKCSGHNFQDKTHCHVCANKRSEAPKGSKTGDAPGCPTRRVTKPKAPQQAALEDPAPRRKRPASKPRAPTPQVPAKAAEPAKVTEEPPKGDGSADPDPEDPKREEAAEKKKGLRERIQALRKQVHYLRDMGWEEDAQLQFDRVAALEKELREEMAEPELLRSLTDRVANLTATLEE